MWSPSHVIRVRKVRQVLLCLSPSLCRHLAASQNHSDFTVCVCWKVWMFVLETSEKGDFERDIR